MRASIKFVGMSVTIFNRVYIHCYSKDPYLNNELHVLQEQKDKLKCRETRVECVAVAYWKECMFFVKKLSSISAYFCLL